MEARESRKAVGREEWIRAAVAALRAGGVNDVAVEALARTLGVTKGSFYWHFADRGELLEQLLRLWERETEEYIAEAERQARPLDRVLCFFTVVARHRGELPDIEYFSWARRDPRIARRVSVAEARRIRFIERELRAAGLDRREAARRAEAGYLSTLGWIERASRSKERASPAELRRFAGHLFRWMFDGTADSAVHVRQRSRKSGGGEDDRARAIHPALARRCMRVWAAAFALPAER
jgi:AcrR family transcriptional regulator